MHICSKIKYHDMKSWDTVFVFEDIDDVVHVWEDTILSVIIVLGARSESEKFNLNFSTIAKLRAGLCNIPSDFSKLINFVESHKDPDEVFSVPDV